MLRLVQLAVLGVVVLGATVLMALPRRDGSARVAVGPAEVREAPAVRDGSQPISDRVVSSAGSGTDRPGETHPIEPPPAPPAAPRTHQVASGDTLQKIAKRYYGSVNQWRRIADANRGVDPSRLRLGTTLVIP